MDYLDVVVHVFTPDARDYYRLETLWGEVPELEVEQAESAYALPVRTYERCRVACRLTAVAVAKQVRSRRRRSLAQRDERVAP